jgi:hypothetical protein
MQNATPSQEPQEVTPVQVRVHQNLLMAIEDWRLPGIQRVRANERGLEYRPPREGGDNFEKLQSSFERWFRMLKLLRIPSENSNYRKLTQSCEECTARPVFPHKRTSTDHSLMSGSGQGSG